MPSLSYLKIRGEPFDAGLALGRFGARAVHDRLMKTNTWRRTMEWRGSARVEAMKALAREQFPRICSEIEGLAKGLEISFDDVFLWQCRGDLSSIPAGGCTTVLLPGRTARRITHNEDGDPALAGFCGIAEYCIAGQPSIVSFVYPGSIPGHTFAMTSAGLGMTVNNMRERELNVGVPRMVLCRAMLEAPDIASAVAILDAHPRAGSFHVALLHRDDPELWSVEFSALRCSVEKVGRPTVHTNHSIHATMRNFPQVITGSSGFRKVRADELLAQFAERAEPINSLGILADTTNQTFPIFRRDPEDSDEENTMATADLWVSTSGMKWTIREAPNESPRFSSEEIHVLQPMAISQ